MMVINKLKSNLYLVGLLVVAGFLRFFHIDFQSLWIDEINTIVQADPAMGFKETYQFLKANDVQPPLYFYILKTMFLVFGYTSVVLRSLSAILGIAAIYVIYLLGCELRNKRTGLIAATILCFNYIHIFYSQEARPYTWLVLFTTLAFYHLIKFLKQPGYKSALLYGIFAGLMLYGHAYGLFSFGAQGILLFYFFWHIPLAQRFLFAKQTLLAFVVMFVLYLPTLPFLLIAGNVTTSWIPMPGLDVFANIFTEYFGHSELLICLISILILSFFISILFSEKKEEEQPIPFLSSDGAVFGFLIIWIVVPILIPLIRTYLTIPMIVPRYLLGVLPAILIMVSIALDRIKINITRNLMIVLVVVFSVVDIFVVKKYYFRPIKSDMRGVSEIVIANKLESETIVSNIAWHYTYYFKQANSKNPMVLNSLNDYLNGIKADTLNLKQFWYVDRIPVLEGVTDANQQFLKRYFYETKKIIKNAAYGSRFTPLSAKTHYLKLNEFSPIGVDWQGQLAFFTNDSTKSLPITLNKGVYKLLITGNSKPVKPVNSIQAHIAVKINGVRVGGLFLSDIEQYTHKAFQFTINKQTDVVIEVVFDNDINLNGKDRNAFISLIEIEKVSEL